MGSLHNQRNFYIENREYNGPAIYCIYNKLSGKKYIGQAQKSYFRAKEHRIHLEKGIHYNTHLQNAYNKDNDLFIFTILEKCKKEELNIKEEFWISYYNTTNKNKGYNTRPGGNCCRGWKHSQNVKGKFSKIMYEKIKNKIIDNNIPISCYSILDGSYIQRFESVLIKK